jgi:hypothetical protein
MVKPQAWKLLIILILTATAFPSCFKEDVRVAAHIQSYAEDSIVNSIYLYESYYSLDSASVLKFNAVDAWDLAFECGTKGWHILVNTGGNKEIGSTGKYSFEDVTSSFIISTWKFDASSGNLDSTAVGKWVDTTTFAYTGEVFIVGSYNSTSGNVTPYRKVKFISVTDSSYQFVYSDFNGETVYKSTVYKNSDVNYVYFSFAQPQVTLNLEPNKTDWDLKFCPYKTLVPASDGTPTPYPVKGVLINYKNNVLAAKDGSVDFDLITYSNISNFTFSAKQDAIGYNWKTYSFSSFTYTLSDSTHFIIKTVKDNYFKLRFTEFYKIVSLVSEEGYPKFDYEKLVP